jgi:hypothetical protein
MNNTMLPLLPLKIIILHLLLLTAFDSASSEAKDIALTAPVEQQVTAKDKPEKATSKSFKTIDWDSLMPEEDLNALLNPPNYLDQIEDDTFEDQISDQLQIDFDSAINDRYQQALVSTKIIKQLDGQLVRIPGFVVPVEFDEESITEFFLVPYFGACIHSPPPPPNQIIYVHAPNGLKLNTLYDPFWISGTINTTLVENYMATAAYSLKMASYEAYTE